MNLGLAFQQPRVDGVEPQHDVAGGQESGDENCATWEDKELDLIRKWASAAESLIHGRASGLDAAVRVRF
jgi:hypothetical protein